MRKINALTAVLCGLVALKAIAQTDNLLDFVKTATMHNPAGKGRHSGLKEPAFRK